MDADLKGNSLLRRVPMSGTDVGNAAAFMASDRAGATTGTVFDLTRAVVD